MATSSGLCRGHRRGSGRKSGTPGRTGKSTRFGSRRGMGSTSTGEGSKEEYNFLSRKKNDFFRFKLRVLVNFSGIFWKSGRQFALASPTPNSEGLVPQFPRNLRPCFERGKGTLCGELRKNGWTDRYAVWVVDSDWPKEACVTWGAHLAPPGEYDWTVRVWRQCSLMSNYFAHLLLLSGHTENSSVICTLRCLEDKHDHVIISHTNILITDCLERKLRCVQETDAPSAFFLRPTSLWIRRSI